MSLFLGPIHHWLYNKIKIQHEITEEIINLDAKLLQDELGTVELKPLEKVIDTSNIHGWLQEKVSLSEERLAKAVAILLKEDEANLSSIEDIFYNKGRELTKNYDKLTATEFYKLMTDTLLDGMPCDHAFTVISEDQDKVTYKQNLCVHKKYWDYEMVDIKIYYGLRHKLIEGMAKDKKLAYNFDCKDTYAIERIV